VNTDRQAHRPKKAKAIATGRTSSNDRHRYHHAISNGTDGGNRPADRLRSRSPMIHPIPGMLHMMNSPILNLLHVTHVPFSNLICGHRPLIFDRARVRATRAASIPFARFIRLTPARRATSHAPRRPRALTSSLLHSESSYSIRTSAPLYTGEEISARAHRQQRLRMNNPARPATTNA